ncbi:MAG: TonB-dependent receptor plug domain-containing protein [Bacteroidota bacterium]|nr:TonB-dependent receptor plug domain-containing protein [Bacteroidota bacterium]
MKKSCCTILLLFVFCMNFVFSQKIVEIEGVTISDTRIDEVSGYKQSTIDTTAIKNNSAASLSSLLSMHSPLFIKSYGQGALATCSFRGTGASHTKIMWNGVDINSPMLGQTDFSVVPVFIIDNVTLNHGGSSVFEGSGALGGSINLTNSASWQEKTKLEFGQGISSFNTYNTMLLFQYGKKKFQSRTRFVMGISENEYPFKNIFIDRDNPPIKYRKGAGYNHYDIVQELYFKPGGKDVFSLKAWAQRYYRDIAAPISVTSRPGNECQENISLRAVVDWKHSLSMGMVKAQMAFVHDFLNYKDDISNIDSDNRSNRWTSNVSYNKNLFGFIDFSSGIRYENITVKSVNYENNKSRNEISLFSGAEVDFSDAFLVRMMLRQRVVDNDFIPLIPTLGVDIRLLQDEEIYFKANVSRNYHLPSMNDLYWELAGNSDLKDEKGVSVESGILYKKRIGKSLRVETEFTGFYNDIDNWIIWLPDSVKSYWTPRNIRNAVSKGVEATLKIQYKNNDIAISHNSSFSFTDARNNKVFNTDDASYKKQLIYVPKYSFGSHLNVNVKKTFLSVDYVYTGKRYTATDNLRYMPAYFLTDFSVGTKSNIWKTDCSIQFKINNVFGKDYQVVAWQPMPGRSFSVSMKIRY